MGKPITWGRRTAALMGLNLAGRGGLPQALSSASTGLKSIIGTIGDVLGLGLSVSETLTLNTIFTVAEAINCSGNQQ